MKTSSFRPLFSLFALLLVLTCGGVPVRAQTIVNNTPYNFNVGQGAQEAGQVLISTSSSPTYGATYHVDFYNSSNQIIGGGDAAPYGYNQQAAFALPCPSAQPSRNVVRGVVTAVYNNLQVNSAQVSKTPVSDPSNLGTTDPAAAPFVGSHATIWGGGLDAAAPPSESWVYWRLHLEKGQTLKLKGWAQSESTLYGAVFEVHIIRNIGEAGAMLVQVAPYGRGNFSGAFTNADEASDFYLRARCTTWKICAFEIKLDAGGTCAPPPRCCEIDSAGRQGTFPVQLATGREQSEFPADLTVYNPLGPDVEWRRQWREALSLQGDASPGFSAGWTHGYDQTLTASDGANLQLNFPNGGVQQLTAQQGTGGTLQLNAPANATFFTRGAAAPSSSNPDDTTFFWDWVEVVWQDGTVWRFTPAERYTYRLTKITSATGQSLTLDYDKPGSGSALDLYWQNLKTTNYASWLQLAQSAYGQDVTRQWRLKTIKNSVNTALLTLDYRTPDGLLNSATDAYNRRIYYSWSTPAGMPTASLTGVSLVFQVGVDTGTLAFDGYAYVAFGGRPLLGSVTRAHPNGTGANGATTATSTNTYDAQGRVASTRDANNNLRTYTYGTNQVGIAVSNAAGTLAQQWTRYLDAENRGKGWADASGHRWETFYDDPNNPRLPTRERDPEGREVVTTYDVYGNPTSVTTPRGVKLTYVWSYAAWPLGRLSSVTKSVTAGGTTTTLPATTFTYYEPSGLPQSATSPHPGGSGTVTTQYAYDSYGNLTSVTEPGDASTPSRTTQLFYTQDGTFTQPMAVGKPVAVRDPAGNVTHLRYTANYNLYSSTDALGNATTYVYDYNDNPIRVLLAATGQTGSGSGEIRYAYAYRGGPLLQTQIYDEAGVVARTFHTDYGAEGEVLGSHGNTLPQSTQYDALYRPVVFQDGNGQQTTFTYNADGRLSATYFPQANAQSGWDSLRTTSFSASGQPLQTVNGRGIVANYTYNDPDGQLTAIAYPASTWENQSFSYDVFGRLSSQSNYSGSESYAYTAAETPASRTTTYKKTDYSNMAPFTVSYAYNASGSLNQLTTPAGALSYAYDTAGRLASLAEPGGRTTQWSYFANDWLQSQKLPVANGGGARSSYAYNALGRVLELANIRLTTGGGTGATLSQWGSATDASTRLLYNASGQMTRNTAASTTAYPWSGQTTYGYDGYGQVSAENSTRSGGYAYGFGYDGAGNPTSWGGGARSFDADNKETTGNSGSATTFGYNGDGTPWLYSNRNRLSATGTVPRSQILSYSSDGQLMQINANAGGGVAGAAVAGYGYRPDGLRA